MYSNEEKYSDVMGVCDDIINSSNDDILECIESVCSTFPDKTFVMADFCTADGGNSIRLLKKIQKQLKNRDVLVVMEDQLKNDFNELFQNVHNSVLGDNMYITASATDMYKRCLPNHFLHFLFSAFGLHWLSTRPSIANGLFVHDGTNMEQAMIKEQAAKDLECFLLNRSLELKPGGAIYMITLIKDNQGQYGSYELHDQMTKTHRQMFDAGLVTKEEYSDMVISQYFRSEDEFRTQLSNNTRLHQEGLRIKSFTVRECLAEEYKPQNHETWAARISTIAKTWSYIQIEPALDSRDNEEKKKLMDTFYDMLRVNLLSCRFHLKYTVADIVITKHK